MLATPMLPFLIALAAAPPAEPKHVTLGPQRVFRTPEVISSAVLPYLACLYDRRGVPLLKVTLGNEASYEREDRDCSATRRRSAASALKLLRHGTVPGRGAAATYVEHTLDDIDTYVATLANGARGIGASVAMEEEVEPAYERYADCLATQMSYIPISADTIMATFQQVMAICRSVREAAVVEADTALAKKGWDPARRAKAAEETFTAADAQWLSIGRQYRDSLIAQSPR